MKLSRLQAELLAERVLETLAPQLSHIVTLEEEKGIRKFASERIKLQAKVTAAQKIVTEHDKELYKIVGNHANVYTSDPIDRILTKMKDRRSPTKHKIADEIQVSSMFADKMELQQFIDSIVIKFLPKEKRRKK